MNNSMISCTMRNVTLNSSIFLKVLSFDAILFITIKSLQMTFFTIKMSLFSTFIMLCLIFHQWMCFFGILIKYTAQVNYLQMKTLLCVILTVSVNIFYYLSRIYFFFSIFRCCYRTRNANDWCKYVLA